MARSITNDFLQDYRFHVFDLSPNPLGLFTFALTPTVGFTGVGAPQLALEKGTIRPGNSFYPIKYIKFANQNTIVLQRGASLADGDFWRWYMAALTGDPGTVTTMSGGRRTLLLAHFSTQGAGNSLGSLNTFRSKVGAQVEGGGVVVAGVQAVKVDALLGTIPSRAWILNDCQPATYQGANDFDATSSRISIRTLGVDYSSITELNLGGV